MERIVYADHSATTYVKKEVLDEMLPYFTLRYGNASSSYKLGAISKGAIENARTKIAHLIGAHSDEIYFTSGGSESDNLIIRGIAMANRHKGQHIITSKIEHLAVLNTCKDLESLGFLVTYLDVDEKGFVHVEDVLNAIRPDTILISIMFANNEIGTIQNIAEIAKVAKEHGIYFHTDAVQAMGCVNIDVEKLGLDALSMSAHKFYGPKGIGAAYIRRGVLFLPCITGGHQEKSMRAGTENTAGIVGMAKALELANMNMPHYTEKLCLLREHTIFRLLSEVEGVTLNGDRFSRLSGNVNISFKGIDAKSLVLMLDMRGIAVSSGSACTTGTSTPSHVLKAIGLSDDMAKSAIRITYGACNNLSDADYIVECIKEAILKLRN